ncbi:hypothetical protein FXO38_35917 [Capsicum annuum]|nr:hypothetical protein FXO38_35917 [Capsicum annuum]
MAGDSGEAESLHGKIDPKNFGDRVSRSTLPEKLQKRKRERFVSDSTMQKTKKSRIQEESSVLNWMEAREGGVYKPNTKETKSAYEAMLSLIQQQLCGQPLNIVRAASDEILAVLNDEALYDVDVGVAVDIEDNEDEEGSDFEEVPSDDEEDDDDYVQLEANDVASMGSGINADEGMTLNMSSPGHAGNVGVPHRWVKGSWVSLYSLGQSSPHELAFEVELGLRSISLSEEFHNLLELLYGLDISTTSWIRLMHCYLF